MPTTRFDVLNALNILAERGQPSATADSVAADLATSRIDVLPQLIAAQRAGLVTAATRPDGITEFALTHAGRAAAIDGAQ